MFGFDDRTRALLTGIRRAGSIAAAARAVGLDASNARRHLQLAQERAGARLVEARRGGRGGQNARLTRAALVWLGEGKLRGVAKEYDGEAGTTPIEVGRQTLHAAGRIPEGPVSLAVDPTSVVLARAAPDGTSARNHVRMTVERVRALSEGTYEVALRAGALALCAHVTRGARRELRLKEGSRVVASVKAVAVTASPV
ncbi:MAG TPA: TOBE domain-containing protein [Candidatus Thermoplasmatota archaeon]|nr:TOBE domain-containing protein [Candidatus Thermoplasmatota archaeon]